MSQYILLRNVQVENANAISGITYGFPSPTHFLGYTHNLSRTLQQRFGDLASFGGVGIICHAHQVQSHRIGYETIFSLTRNPITHEGKTAPFNEEGRMHFTVSLLIECNFDVLDLEQSDGTPEQREKEFCTWLRKKAEAQRLAGGTISKIDMLKVLHIDSNSDEGEREFRRWMLRLIPGFVLQDRHDALVAHHQVSLQHDAKTKLLDSWLDFVALDSEALLPEDFESEPIEGETPATWSLKSKPETGYFVPLMVGFESISELYEPGAVVRARDNTEPFRFVESAYSLGQWVGPHRIKSPSEMLWHYHYEEEEQGGARYLCHSKKDVNQTVSTDAVSNLFDDDY